MDREQRWLLVTFKIAIVTCKAYFYLTTSPIDAPGALHHIIARGIARKKVFDDNADRNFFVDRLGVIFTDTSTQCFAWALITNHFHLLLKTGATPISTVMKRLLTGIAMHYNRRHKRHGQSPPGF